MSTKMVYWILGAVVLGGLLWGAYQYPKEGATPFVGSSAGATFQTAKIAEQIVGVSTSTQVAILNGDVSDRIITDGGFYIANSAATTSTYTIFCATSSVATGFSPANTNWLFNQNINGIGTTTGAGGTYVSSTSPGITGTAGGTNATSTRVWGSGTYLMCQINNNASANDVDLFSSGTTGYIGFGYKGE